MAMKKGRKPVSREVRRQVFGRAGGHCYYCARPLYPQDMHVEHGLPIAQGGTNDIWNLYPSCQPCNAAKRTMTMAEFRARVGCETFFGDIERVRELSLRMRASYDDQFTIIAADWQASFLLWGIATHAPFSRACPCHHDPDCPHAVVDAPEPVIGHRIDDPLANVSVSTSSSPST